MEGTGQVAPESMHTDQATSSARGGYSYRLLGSRIIKYGRSLHPLAAAPTDVRRDMRSLKFHGDGGEGGDSRFFVAGERMITRPYSRTSL